MLSGPFVLDIFGFMLTSRLEFTCFKAKLSMNCQLIPSKRGFTIV